MLVSVHTQRVLSELRATFMLSYCVVLLKLPHAVFFLFIHSWKKDKTKEKKSSRSQCLCCLEKWVETDNSLYWWREGLRPGSRVGASCCRQHLGYFWPLGPSLSSWKEKESEVAQSCPTLCDPMDCNPPGSSVHGILQARILEWGAISLSRSSSLPRDWARVSCMAGRRFTVWATSEGPVSSWLPCRKDAVSGSPSPRPAPWSLPAPASGPHLLGSMCSAPTVSVLPLGGIPPVSLYEELPALWLGLRAGPSSPFAAVPPWICLGWPWSSAWKRRLWFFIFHAALHLPHTLWRFGSDSAVKRLINLNFQ